MGELFKSAKSSKKERKVKAQTTAQKERTTLASSGDKKSIGERRAEKQQEKIDKVLSGLEIDSSAE